MYMMSINDLLDKIEALLAENIIDDEEKGDFNSYKLLKGATDDEINAFEKDVGILLPEDFKEYYKIKNGSGDCKILYTAEFANWNTYLLLPLETMKFLLTTAAFCSHKFLPFAVAGMGGNGASHGVYLAFDFYPAQNGKKGQIIRYVHDDHDDIDSAAATFTELLEKSKNSLENNVHNSRLHEIGFGGEGINRRLRNFMESEERIVNTFSGF